MEIKDKLHILIVTFNRANFLRNSLNRLLANHSPVKDYKITVLDNNSDDETHDVVKEFQQEHNNVEYIKNPINIGGCANIANALTLHSKLDYIWVLADNDEYDFSCWSEVEGAIEDNYDAIMTLKTGNNPSEIIYSATLVSGAIYKKSIINSSVACNIYDCISNLFPHLAIICKIINDNGKIFIPSNDIVNFIQNDNQKNSYVRGVNPDEIPESRKNIFWEPGYFKALELIKDKKLRHEIIENTRHSFNSLFDLFKATVLENRLFFNNSSYNLYNIFRILSFKQKLKFLLALLWLDLYPRDYKFFYMHTQNEWQDYFKAVDEQKYLDKLAKKLENKKVLLYGAGLVAQTLIEEYDLSNFNIVGISDKKYDKVEDSIFYSIKPIPYSKINECDYDVILFTLKMHKKVKKSLRKSGIKKPMLSAIATNFWYCVEN